MKSIKTFLLSLATLLTIGASSCVSGKSEKHDQIDVDRLKTELTKAVGQSINEPAPVSETEANDNSNNNVTAVNDSISLSKRPTVINVYVDVPAENSSDFFDDDDFLAALAIIMVFAVPCVTFLLIVIAILVFIYKRNRNRNAVIQQAIESGYPLPETFYNNNRYHADKKRNPQLLQTGIKNIGVGILLCISFSVFFNLPFVGVMCLIPAVIGTGQLITYYSLDNNNVNCSESDSNND